MIKLHRAPQRDAAARAVGRAGEAGALSDFLAGAGVLVAAAASAAAILLPPGRPRSAAMLLAIVLFPVLILGDQWHTHQIVDLRHDDGRIVGLLVGRPSPSSAPSPTSSAAGRSCCRWRSSPRSPSASRCTPAATPRTCWCRSTW